MILETKQLLFRAHVHFDRRSRNVHGHLEQTSIVLNPKKPKQTKLMEHRIITPDALPANNKPH